MTTSLNHLADLSEAKKHKDIAKTQKQHFCVTCGNSFDKEDSFFEAYELHAGNLPVIGNPLCPLCCPENWSPQYYPTARIEKIRK